jgi:hypothetical protein
MRYDIPSLGKKCLGKHCLQAAALLAFLALALQFAPASNPSLASQPLLSGSYEVVQSTARGSETQLRVRIHLVNHGPSDLTIQRMTLWDLSHPEKGGSRACALTLRAHASADTTQDFTIKRSDYQSWQRGFRPRLVLQTASAGNAYGRAPNPMKSKSVVRLDHISSRTPAQEAK